MGLMSWIDYKSGKLCAWDIAFVKIGERYLILLFGHTFQF
jgi:hypothetical protein